MTSTHLHTGHYHLPRMTEMGRVFWAHTLGALGSSFVTILIPIFLLKTGYSLSAVMIYLMFSNLFGAAVQYPAAKFIARFGANKGMAIAQLFSMTYLGMLLTLPSFHWPLVLIAAFWGLDRAFYWTSFHVNFSKSRSQGRTGRQVSVITSVVTVAHGLTPAIGGIIATAAGIGWVYGLAILFIAISALPLIRGAEVSRRRSITLQNIQFRKIRRDLLSNVCNGITTASELAIWPLIIFLIVRTYAGVGILSSVVAVASILIALYVGRHEEHKGERHYLREGLSLETVTNVLRAIASNAGHVFGVNLINGVSRSLYTTPYMTRYYRHADEEPRLEYITAMEIANILGLVMLYGAVLVATLLFSPQTALLVGVILAAPASFGTRLIR